MIIELDFRKINKTMKNSKANLGTLTCKSMREMSRYCQCTSKGGWLFTKIIILMWNSLTSWCKDCLTLPLLKPSTVILILGFCDIRDEKSKLINHILTLLNILSLQIETCLKQAVNFHALKLCICSVQKIEQKSCFQGKQTRPTLFEMATNCPLSWLKNTDFSSSRRAVGFCWVGEHDGALELQMLIERRSKCLSLWSARVWGAGLVCGHELLQLFLSRSGC